MSVLFKEYKLGEHLILLTDYHANGSYEILKKHVELKDDPDYAIMIRTTNFENNDFTQKLKYITENAYNFLKKSKVHAGDILMNKIANAGSVYYVPKLRQPVSLAMNLFLLRINTKTANQKYVYKYLKCNENYIKTFATGTAAVTITKNAVRNLDILLPPLSIQKKIAAILSAYDELIENNNRRIAILEKMAEEIYREWFVRMRFPGHEKVKVVKGVPEGWELKRFRDLISYYIGGGWGNDYQNIEFYKPAYVIRGTDIPKLNDGIFKHEILRYHKASNFKTRQLIKDDIVFEVSGGSKDQLLGRTLLITKDLLKFFNSNVICASFCKLIRPNQKNVNPLFLKYFFKLYYDTGMVGTFQTQSTGISNYHFEDFLNFQTLNVPDITTQSKFENTVQPIIEEKDALSLENSTLKQSRDLLLPRLISGKLDVEKLDITFPPGMSNVDPTEGKEADAA